MIGDFDASRRLLVGTRQILRAARQGRLEKVFVATDAQARMIEEVLGVCRERGIPTQEAGTMRELGAACRIAVGAAAAGVLKPEEHDARTE